MTADENLRRLGQADPLTLSQASAQVVPATLGVSLPEEVVQALVGAGTLGSFNFIGSETYRLADGSAVVSRTIRLRSIEVRRSRKKLAVAELGNLPRRPAGQLMLAKWPVSCKNPSGQGKRGRS